jgi:hypothetical protein
MITGSSTATNSGPGEGLRRDLRRPLESDVGRRRMSPVARRTVAVVVVAHGLFHLLGAAQGLGWANVSQLKEPISWSMGLAWLMAAAVVLGAGVLLASSARWSWAVGAAALLMSQGLIITAWSDAKAGTLANVVLLVAVAFGYASRGSTDASHPMTGPGG